MEIYLDIVLIENFVIDMFILLITAKLMHIKYNNKSLYISIFFRCVIYSCFRISRIKDFFFISLSNISSVDNDKNTYGK